MKDGVAALVRFARLASQAGSGSAMLPLLADTVAERVPADGVAIVEITPQGAALVPSHRTPKELEGFAVDPDAMGAELSDALLAKCAKRFATAVARPLVSGGGLYGSIIMFFAKAPNAEGLTLADGLIDMAAVTLESAKQLHDLAASQALLRATEEALARAEKLRALGQMAAGVSHDLKNILNPLSLHLQLVERAIGKDPQAIRDSVTEMKQIVIRGVQTVERLRDYSRQSPESKASLVDLDKLVAEAQSIARPHMASRKGALSRIHEELGGSKPVLGRAGDIVSAVVNLVVNAIDAMKSGGNITLRTGSDANGSWLTVSDDGPGMPREIADHVFEPFFTTKGDDGTGLGLAMVYACMQRHGGSVALETAPGKGTTFTLSFPRAPGT